MEKVAWIKEPSSGQALLTMKETANSRWLFFLRHSRNYDKLLQ